MLFEVKDKSSISLCVKVISFFLVDFVGDIARYVWWLIGSKFAERLSKVMSEFWDCI